MLLTDLPELFPGIFARLIGHSVYAYSSQKNGTWLEESWVGTLDYVMGAAFLIGFIWAIRNIAIKKSIKKNVLAVAFFVVWMMLSLLGTTGYFTGYL